MCHGVNPPTEIRSGLLTEEIFRRRVDVLNKAGKFSGVWRVRIVDVSWL